MLDRKTRKKIEWAFRSYATLRTQAAEYLVDIAESGLTPNYGAVGGSSCAGNPTEVKGIRAAEHTAVLWCKVVEKTMERFEDTGKDTLIKLKYFKNEKERHILDKLYIDRSAYYDWINDILTYATMIALQFGVIKII